MVVGLNVSKSFLQKTVLFEAIEIVPVVLERMVEVMVEAETVLAVLQLALLVSTKPITFPLLNELEVYVEDVAPEMLLPLRVHW